MPSSEKLRTHPSNYNTDNEFFNVWKHLSNVFDNSEIRELKTVQSMVETTSAKKNLKRTTEAKTNKFNFVREGKILLIYPSSLSVEHLVIYYRKSLKKIKKLEVMVAKEKIVSDSGRVFKQEIIEIKFSMQWLPKADDWKVTNFKI